VYFNKVKEYSAHAFTSSVSRSFLISPSPQTEQIESSLEGLILCFLTITQIDSELSAKYKKFRQRLLSTLKFQQSLKFPQTRRSLMIQLKQHKKHRFHRVMHKQTTSLLPPYPTTA